VVVSKHHEVGSARNPRLDPYRHRAAEFRDNKGRRGRFYVEPHQGSTAISGHLWWTRWSPPEEFVILWLETPEGYDTDTSILPEDLPDELDAWDQGQFRFLEETYQLTWLDDAATEAMRAALEIDEA
ncbi:MAG TPA: hypothetical protein VLR88_10235, partial [Propionibacteriaceae bacterium]|nr:hypothetical protein [Propionibacteriaceae bacterium]